MSDGSRVLELTNLRRTFYQGGAAIEVLRGVSFSIAEGEVVALTGPSGAGKSTLLQLAGLLEQPDGGEIIIAGESCAAMSERQRTRARREKLGFVYQFHHLLPEFTALENVAMPLLIRGETPAVCQEKAAATLKKVGLDHRLSHKPSTLSGGERQRVAIARALVTEPALVMADEPTGNLDERTAAQVQSLMLELNETLGTAFMIVTHDREFASRCPQQYELHDGLLRRLGSL